MHLSIFNVVSLIVAGYIAVAPGAAAAASSPVPVAGTEGAQCAGCHREIVAAWQNSHHARAMQHAGPATVLGAFDGQILTHAGERTLLSRQGAKFLATISSSEGNSAAEQFEILYTFGASPLQQYLVEIEPDRLQALPWAWDTRPETEGGGRWYHLYEGDTVPPGDRLHWKSSLQNWNGMCADCHSTGLARNYDVSGDHFETSAAAISVSCASCHSSAAEHILAMERQEQVAPGTDGDIIRFRDSSGSRFERDEGMTTARDSASPHQGQEIEVCAACHSRRTPLTDKIDPALAFLDQFTPVLLDEGLYHADGQIQDEVYVWGSFMQSKMAAAGVTCTHCHEAHGPGLKREGNALCASCHAPAVFDSRDHHRHPAETDGAQCTACHMPQSTYMGIDARRDHSFKVPRPALSESIGTPNACTTCHTEMTNAAAAAHVTEWFGPRQIEGSATLAISAARARDPAARIPLRALIEDDARPDILRATALSLIPNVPDRTLLSVASSHLNNTNPLIRIGSIRALTILSPEERARALTPLLEDGVKSVRLEAAAALQNVPTRALSGADRILFDTAIEELLQANDEIAWRGEGRLARALIYQGQGDRAQAMATYKSAIEIDPAFTPPYINLSELLRSDGKDEAAMATLLEGLANAPGDAALEHALGLALIRAGKPEEAMAHLERATSLAPQTPRFAYVHAVALHSAGEASEARARLEAALGRAPHDPQLLTLALSFASEDRNTAAMLTLARALARISPEDPNWDGLIKRLEQK